MGRKPTLDPVSRPLDCRKIREAVRFGSRRSNPVPGVPFVRWAAMCREYGFKNHQSLRQVAERYEKAFDLGPEDREDPIVVAQREDAADKA